jgi:hypothetical protein
MFPCEQHCNIVPQYCNFDRQIALSKLQPTRTNCKLEIHKRFVNKASDWIIRKREANQIVWATGLVLPLSYSPIRGFVYKSFVNFNLQFVRVGCKLLRAICLSKLQYCGTILQCCSQENIRFDCNTVEDVVGEVSDECMNPSWVRFPRCAVVWLNVVACVKSCSRLNTTFSRVLKFCSVLLAICSQENTHWRQVGLQGHVYRFSPWERAGMRQRLR